MTRAYFIWFEVDALDIFTYGIEELFEAAWLCIMVLGCNEFIGIHVYEPIDVIVPGAVDCVHYIKGLSGGDLVEVVDVELGAGFVAERTRVDGRGDCYEGEVGD